MSSFVEIIAKLKPKNSGNFKLLDAQDVECDEGKGLDEVLNEKLDKNQGAKNAGKTMVVGADGNLVVGDSSPKNVYTKEEVDYLLYDKMDKPYYDIAITDDTTIENTLAGNFKMDSIEGSIYQAEESGIVPTPERPVPIRSKKITVDGEIVELRSLKESVNIFSLDDFYITNKVNCTIEKITNGLRLSNSPGIRDSYIELNFNLKANKTYTISFTADTTNSSFVNLVDNRLFSLAESNWNNPNWSITLDSEKGIKSYKQTFTPTVDCKVFLYAMNLALAEQEGYVDFTNIMLVEGDSAPSSYVAPTVRDYKMVDHTTKTSKIVRNVGYKLFTNGDNFYKSGYGGIETQLQDVKIQSASVNTKSYCNMFYASNQRGLPENLRFRLDDLYLQFNYKGYNDIDKWREFLNSNELYFAYELAAPTEESIPYVETDTSEVGLSWQDSTSPSPDIESKMYEVNEINIKLVGKNINNRLIRNHSNNGQSDSVWRSFDMNCKPNTVYTATIFKGNNNRFGFYSGIGDINDVNANYNDVKGSFISYTGDVQTFTITTGNDDNVMWVYLDNNNIQSLDDVVVQVEEGDISTSYTPYQEASIQHALSKPLRATKDGSVRDIIDIVNMQTIYNMLYLRLMKDMNWAYSPSLDQTKKNFFKCILSYNINKKNSFDGVSNYFPMDNPYRIYDKDCFSCYTLQNDIRVRLDRVDSLAEFKQWLDEKEVYVLLPLAEPTTEPLEDKLVEKLKQLKTFSPTTHVFVTGIAKPTLNAKYPKDIAAAQAQLEAKLLTLQTEVVKNV